VLMKDALLRDDPPNPEADDDTPPPERLRRVFTDTRPDVFDCIADLRSVIDEMPGRLCAGEADTATGRVARFYCTPHRPGLHAPLNYTLLDGPWDARSVGARIDEYLGALPDHGQPNWAIGSHDKKRIADRLGQAQARIAAMLLLTLPGIVFFYAGDELGLECVPIAPDRVRDPFEILLPGYGLGRDPERTPMRWDAGPNAGFTSGDPWLPIGNGMDRCNVAVQRDSPGSMLHLYQRLIALRGAVPALRRGGYRPMREQGDALLFTRVCDDGDVLVALNLGSEPQQVCLPKGGRVLVSTSPGREDEAIGPVVSLQGDEGLLVEME
jgi:alpha-glucosidase